MTPYTLHVTVHDNELCTVHVKAIAALSALTHLYSTHDILDYAKLIIATLLSIDTFFDHKAQVKENAFKVVKFLYKNLISKAQGHS